MAWSLVLYMEVPKCYDQQWKKEACLLQKALYCLKQSPRLCYERLTTPFFSKLSLHSLHADDSVFITGVGNAGPMITTYMHDLNIFVPKNPGIIAQVKKKLSTTIGMMDMKLLAY